MTIGLQWMDGFDEWHAMTPFVSLQTFFIKWAISGFAATASGNSTAVLCTGGRRGTGGWLAVSTNGAGTDCIFRASFATGATSTVVDNTSFFAGFNAYLGISAGMVAGLVPATGTVSGGYCRVFGFAANSPSIVTGGVTQHKITFWYNQGTNSFIATKGTGTPPGGTGAPLTAVASGQPARNPWQQWTYFEIGVYRSATSGTIDLWIENSGGTLDHLLSATALDTSVATLGSINTCFLAAGVFNSAIWFPVGYDDFWLALSGSPGTPCYVLTLTALAESTQSGATWTASSGADTATVVSALPLDMSDYASFPYTVTGAIGNASLLFTQTTLPYTPANVFAIQTLSVVDRTGAASGSSARFTGRFRKGVTDYDGPGQNTSFISGAVATSTGNSVLTFVGNILEQDPDTSAAWVPSTANTVLFGVAASGGIVTTGGASYLNAVYGSYVLYLASIASGSAIPPGGPASGLGQPFWIIQTG